MRAVKNWVARRHPVCVGDAARQFQGRPRVARPASTIRVGSPERRTRATCSTGPTPGALAPDDTARDSTLRGFARLAPGGLSGQDQGRDATGFARGLGNRRGGISGDRMRRIGAPHPMAQRTRQALDIRDQRSIVLQMRGSVLADDIDHAGTRTASIVNVGKTIGQAGPEMQQRGRRTIFHPVPAIGGTRCNAFKQTKDAAQTRIFQRRQEVHLRRSRIGETNPTPSSVRVFTRLSAPFNSVPFGATYFLPTISLAFSIASYLRTGADMMKR